LDEFAPASDSEKWKVSALARNECMVDGGGGHGVQWPRINVRPMAMSAGLPIPRDPDSSNPAMTSRRQRQISYAIQNHTLGIPAGQFPGTLYGFGIGAKARGKFPG